MIAAARRFTCAADEVWRLQRGSEADCVFFQRMVNGGERITDRGSRQGTWICAPGGVVLARTGSRDPDQVLATFERAWAAWEELPEEAKRVPEDAGLEPEHRWEASYPEDGLALERIGRELPPEGLDGPPSPRWNRDYAWFSAAEIRGLVPHEARAGATFELPLVAERLARFHLVDNVRGQSLPFAPEELAEARLTATVLARDGGRLTLSLAGRTSATAEGPWLLGHNLWKPRKELPHGLDCELAGTATYDLGAGAFERFELVALGSRWGRTQLNGRGRDASPGFVAFHLDLAPPGRRIAPTFVAVYDADWIAHPAVPTWLESPAECGLEAR